MTRNMELKLETLRNAVQEVNDVISASGNPKVKDEAVKEAVKAINDQVIAEAVEGLRSMEPSQMWPEYLDHQFVPGYAVKADKDTGKYAIIMPEEEKACKVRIPFAALDNAGERLSLSGNWADMLRIFCENVVINQSNDMGRAYAARNAMSASWMDKRSKMGAHWQPAANGTISMNALVEMLNDLVTDIVPVEYAPKMIKADVKYFALCLCSGKRPTADEAGKIVVRNAQSMENYLFRAIYTRRNKLAYEWHNKQERDETKDQTVVDSMPGEYVETPEAGPVSVVGAAEPETETEAA